MSTTGTTGRWRCSSAGGEDWGRWNSRLRDAILPLQEREQTKDGRKHHTFGSWPPFGPNWGMFGRMAGRVYTTAVCTLTLEIYYRHTPAFLKDDVLFSAEDWRIYWQRSPARERRTVVDCLAQLRVEVAEPVLVDLLVDNDRRIALAAAEALAQVDSPMGLPLMDKVLTTLPPWERKSLEQAVARAQAVAALPPVEGRVRFYDAAAGLATLDLPRQLRGDVRTDPAGRAGRGSAARYSAVHGPDRRRGGISRRARVRPRWNRASGSSVARSQVLRGRRRGCRHQQMITRRGVRTKRGV